MKSRLLLLSLAACAAVAALAQTFPAVDFVSVSANATTGQLRAPTNFFSNTTNAGAMANAVAGGTATVAGRGLLTVAGTTGTGNVVLASSPTLVTPALGAATATSVSAPTATALTLTGGSSGASLALGALGAGNAAVTLTALGTSDLTMAVSAGAFTLNSARTAVQGATIVVNNTSTNGPLFQWRKSGARVGDIGASGNYLGTTAADFFIGAQTNLVLYTNFSGTESARLTTTGNLLIGTTTDMSGSGGLRVAGTTASTSTTTGALVVSGGGAFAGNLNVGGTQNTFGLPATASALSTNSTLTFELTSNTSLKVLVRGTDGTTRSVTLTLAP